MNTARLYGARDIRLDEMPAPRPPEAGEVLLAISSVGVCGSDLHTYEDGRIGDTVVHSPVILGHEFAGDVIAVGPDALDGLHNPLQPGQRVAVDPAVPCWHCEMCEHGHPNLCTDLRFYGLWPDDGAMREQMIVSARSCFPIPDSLSNAEGALLEPLGVAIHAVDLAKIKVADSVAILGCGPIGLLILKMARLAGADPIYCFDRYPWRVEKAKAWDATDAWLVGDDDPATQLMDVTGGRGVDVAIEAAWSGEAVQQAAAMSRMGGRVVLAGIPGDDGLSLRHSTARRKGLTLVMVRRMKHTYPRAIQLATRHAEFLDLHGLISHRMPLADTAQAYALNAAYEDNVVKIVVDVQPERA